MKLKSVFQAGAFLFLTGFPVLGLAGFMDQLDDTVEQIDSHLRSACARALLPVQGRLIKHDFIESAAYNETTKLTVVNAHTANQIDDLTHGLILGLTFTKPYLSQLFQKDDVLHSYNGRVVRVRPSNGSVVLVPKLLERFLFEVNLLDWNMIRSVRYSWPLKNVMPIRIELRQVDPSLLSGMYSSWRPRGQDFVYEVQIKARSRDPLNLEMNEAGYYNLEVVFKSQHTEISLKPRKESHVYVFLEDRQKQFIETMKSTKLRKLVETIESGKPLVVKMGLETERVFQALEEQKHDLNLFY